LNFNAHEDRARRMKASDTPPSEFVHQRHGRVAEGAFGTGCYNSRLLVRVACANANARDAVFFATEMCPMSIAWTGARCDIRALAGPERFS